MHVFLASHVPWPSICSLVVAHPLLFRLSQLYPGLIDSFALGHCLPCCSNPYFSPFLYFTFNTIQRFTMLSTGSIVNMIYLLKAMTAFRLKFPKCIFFKVYISKVVNAIHGLVKLREFDQTQITYLLIVYNSSNIEDTIVYLHDHLGRHHQISVEC